MASYTLQSKKMAITDTGDGTYALATLPMSVTVGESTDDATVKNAAGTVYAVIVTGKGVTAGDTVVLKDNTTAKITFVFSGANETLSFTPSVGLTFATSIKVDITKSGGAVTADVVYA